jgi:membrane protease subunit HflK
VYSNVSKVLVESRSGSNLLYLPLDKLMQQTGAAPLAPVAPVPTPAADAGAAADPRTRDGVRSRDRESR